MTAPSHPGLSQLHSKAEALLVAVQYYNLNIEFSGKAKFVPRNQNYRKERSGTHWKHCRMRREEAEGQTKYMSEVCKHRSNANASLATVIPPLANQGRREMRFITTRWGS